MVRIDINFTPGKQPEIKVHQTPMQPVQPHQMQPVQQHPQHHHQAQSSHQPQSQPTQPGKFVTSEEIVQYLLGTNEQVETLILCKPENVELITSDFNVYEAFGCVKPSDNVPLNKITKLFEAVNITSFKENSGHDKPILKEDRVEQLRIAAKTNYTGGI